MGYEGRGRGEGAVGSRWGDNALGYVTLRERERERERERCT